jgi:hypothetical protein
MEASHVAQGGAANGGAREGAQQARAPHLAREQHAALEHGLGLFQVALVDEDDRVRLQAVELGPPIVGRSQLASRRVDVVDGALALAFVLAEQREREEGARLPVRVLVCTRILEEQLELLPRTLEVGAVEGAESALLDESHVLKRLRQPWVSLEAGLDLLKQLTRLLQ